MKKNGEPQRYSWGRQKKKKKKKNGEPQRYRWERKRSRRRRMVKPRDIAGEGRRRRRKMVNPRDIDGNAKEVEEEEWWTPEIKLGWQQKKKWESLFVGCLSSQQQASVSQGRIRTDNFTCCHTETEAADQTFHLTQSQHTDTGPTSPSADPITPGAWQGSHWSANFEVTGMTRPRKNPGASGIRTRDLPLSRRTP